ncbi:hypothetical protein HDU84_009197, partial [Entophlyctis sp. JEL0112]
TFPSATTPLAGRPSPLTRACWVFLGVRSPHTFPYRMTASTRWRLSCLNGQPQPQACN